MNINYIFVRHGNGCHNAIRTLYNDGMISKEVMQNYNTSEFYDPELTSVGVNASIHNGSVISKMLKNTVNKEFPNNLDLSTMNVVGCSPLIRCMETAYYMTRKWKNPPNKIYVFPYLREINEGSDNKYSSESINIMNTNSSYAMKNIADQKKYLRENGILNYFDFSFVEQYYNERNAPGDVKNFINWFCKKFVTLINPVPKLNVFITTHAGVLRDFANEGFINNSGFILTTKLQGQNIEYYKYLSLNPLLPNDFITEYSSSDFIKSGKKIGDLNRCKYHF